MFETFDIGYLKKILVLLAKLIKFHIQIPIVEIGVFGLNRSFANYSVYLKLARF